MLRSLDSRLGSGSVRLLAAALAGVALVAASAATTPGRPRVVAADAVHLTPHVGPTPVVPAPHPVRRAKPAEHTNPRAAKKAAAVRRVARPVARWLPTGTGMWLHDVAKAEHGNAGAVVRRARQVGLTTLYVQTGSSKNGWMGGLTLPRLLQATRGSQIRVVAWDFPTLADPVADARRMAAAVGYRCRGCSRVAAVAPDVETAAEGTHIGAARVTAYFRTLRRLLPRDVAILATVPWPSEKRIGKYPYAQVAAYADGLMPMAYWYNRSPAGVTARSMSYLRRFHRPVMPVGQGYDGRIDAPYLPADPHPGASVQQFLDQAHRAGARAVSLWSWDTAGTQQWQVLARGRGLFHR